MKKIVFKPYKFLAVFMGCSILVFLLFNEQIMENKYAKAKMEIFESIMTDGDLDVTKEKTKQILDSLFQDNETQ